MQNALFIRKICSAANKAGTPGIFMPAIHPAGMIVATVAALLFLQHQPAACHPPETLPIIVDSFKDTAEFRDKFDKTLQIGATANAVRNLLGEPSSAYVDVWTYFEDRAPYCGEQHMIYAIDFKDERVVSKKTIGGVDAVCAAPPPNRPLKTR